MSTTTKAGDQYADLVVESNFDYPPQYGQHMPTVEEQIDILRARWPQLKPDNAIRYVRETYQALDLPSWVESPFVLIRPGFFSDIYYEEVNEVLKVVALSRKLRNDFLGMEDDFQAFQRDERALRCEERMAKLQPGDLWVVGGQFGKVHRGEAVLRVCERINTQSNEWAFGVRDIGCMTFTHPHRFNQEQQLHVDCAGDKCGKNDEGIYACMPKYVFIGEELVFDWHLCNSASPHYGSATGFLPQ